MLRKSAFVVLVISSLLLFPQLLQAAYTAVSSNSWVSGNSLTAARSGATATILQDGRVLFAGGFDAAGNPLASTEIVGTDGSVSAGPALSNRARITQPSS